jgi:hypothetical protein
VLAWNPGWGITVVAGAELFCNWKLNQSLSFEGTRKASFRYQAKRSKPRNTNMPVVWGRRQVTRREPHILDCSVDATHLRGYHKPNKYCHGWPLPLKSHRNKCTVLSPETEMVMLSLQQANGLLPHPTSAVLDENYASTNKTTKCTKRPYMCA